MAVRLTAISEILTLQETALMQVHNNMHTVRTFIHDIYSSRN